MDSQLRSLFIVSLNALLDLHQSRKTVALQYRIPESMWLSVYLLSILSMLAVGHQSAGPGYGDCEARRWWRHSRW